MKEDKLLHKDLTYTLRGMLFAIHNALGQYRNEKQYADALEYGLQKKNILYKREYSLPISFPGELSGRNRVDFLINDVLVIELKVVTQLTKDHYF